MGHCERPFYGKRVPVPQSDSRNSVAVTLCGCCIDFMLALIPFCSLCTTFPFSRYISLGVCLFSIIHRITPSMPLHAAPAAAHLCRYLLSPYTGCDGAGTITGGQQLPSTSAHFPLLALSDLLLMIRHVAMDGSWVAAAYVKPSSKELIGASSMRGRLSPSSGSRRSNTSKSQLSAAQRSAGSRRHSSNNGASCQRLTRVFGLMEGFHGPPQPPHDKEPHG